MPLDFTERPDHSTAYAHGIATANPTHAVSQQAMCDLMAESSRIEARRLKRLLGVFPNAGVKRRYSARPIEELRISHRWPARNACFIETAETLLAETNQDAIAQSGLEPVDIDFVVSVTTTGMAVPDMSARQVGALGLRPDVRRIPLYGFGCAGGVTGLAHAAVIARAHPGSHVLLQFAELCLTLLDPTTDSPPQLIASALFGDGVASVVISTEGPGLFSIGTGHEQILPDTHTVMAWGPGEGALEMALGLEVPTIIKTHLGTVAGAFTDRSGVALDSVDAVFAHPGSLKVIAAIEESLALPEGTLADTRAVLENYGNMSSVTVLFILQRALNKGFTGPFVMSAIGPGITAALLEGEVAGTA
ncbi:MAG: type III polyketide synthase [Hyphomicrobiales bacterium]|nr:type III polyketide synthase [Hyphomicrobiales bacterium]